eukprot:scaffold7357_cov195-Pinguiococcus_pyrenoidosus.AAC.12
MRSQTIGSALIRTGPPTRKFTNLGRLSFYKQIQFKWGEDGSLTIDHSKYIEKILTEFDMQDCRGVATPILDDRLDHIHGDAVPDRGLGHEGAVQDLRRSLLDGIADFLERDEDQGRDAA